MESSSPETTPAGVARPGQRWLIGGGALLLVAISMPWYVAERGGIDIEGLTFSWQWVPYLVVLLLLNVLFALGVAFGPEPREGGARPRNLIGLVIACAAVVWTGFRLWVAPVHEIGFEVTANVQASIGPWFALAACLVILRGQWLAAGLPAGRIERGSPQA